MKKKQDDETKVYLVYDEELDQFVLKKGDDCTILEVLDLKDPGTEKLISILIKALEREFVVNYLSHAVQKFLWKWLLTVVTITHL